MIDLFITKSDIRKTGKCTNIDYGIGATYKVFINGEKSFLLKFLE